MNFLFLSMSCRRAWRICGRNCSTPATASPSPTSLSVFSNASIWGFTTASIFNSPVSIFRNTNFRNSLYTLSDSDCACASPQKKYWGTWLDTPTAPLPLLPTLFTILFTLCALATSAASAAGSAGAGGAGMEAE
eukprot:CAMPEP_0173278070 /NCGR_PEP_ID=MMETSP1143-20121109/4420_1 /TAXON_ID=483371 /ORGANISM="non described non described, Strain CCMP2298" /LENGTH=133 /DNA_ID=CAMNT_0014215209 /DNA_START=18 /DNA_END=419 /DNA_ORIENTATION=-